jgi:hypothetical protein
MTLAVTQSAPQSAPRSLLPETNLFNVASDRCCDFILFGAEYVSGGECLILIILMVFFFLHTLYEKSFKMCISHIHPSLPP